MAKATFWQKGEKIDYKNAGTEVIGNGDIVVIGSKIGVAGNEIAVGATGSLVLSGIFKMPKGTAEAITLGAKVYWDKTNGVITATVGSNTEAGFAVAAAATADTTVLVHLN